jgi:dTDP-4-dehydrorhamnose reductase
LERVYITGVYGMLGTALSFWMGRANDVHGCDRGERPAGARVDADILDITDFEATRAALDSYRPTVVVHTAAMIGVDDCERRPPEARLVNALATANIGEAAKRLGARMVYISTDAVFDGQGARAYSETDVPRPRSVYGETKLEGERTTLGESDRNLVLRTTIYGWNLKKKSSFAEWIHDSLVNGKEISMFVDVLFTPTYVNELARITQDLLGSGASGLFHAAGSESCSKHDFGVRLAGEFGLDASLVRPIQLADYGGFLAPRSRNMRLDTSKLSGALGRPTQSVEEGLSELRFDKARYRGIGGTKCSK